MFSSCIYDIVIPIDGINFKHCLARDVATLTDLLDTEEARYFQVNANITFKTCLTALAPNLQSNLTQCINDLSPEQEVKACKPYSFYQKCPALRDLLPIMWGLLLGRTSEPLNPSKPERRICLMIWGEQRNLLNTGLHNLRTKRP